MSLLAELKRRKVLKIGAAYLVVAWLAIQAASIGFPAFGAPPWVLRVFILVVLLGFPIALVFAWVFDMTPEGVKLEVAPVGNKRMFAIAAGLIALALGWYYVGQPAMRGTGVKERSVAVLPFVNMSADPAQEFFSDGISEELLNRLAQLPDLKVAARTSAFQFKGKNLDVAEIGRRLKVAHVLEGSVRKSGSRLRITAQLIDSASGYHLWSETFERDASDVFKVQDEIATAIATALEAKLGGRPAAPAARAANPVAYDAYLQGRAFFARRGDNLKQAVAAYDRAIARDPNYSPAHSGRAFALAVSQFWGPWLPMETTNAQALASVEEALRLDPSNAEAYLVRGVVKSGQFRVREGRADFERAYALTPGSVDVLNFFGDDLEFTGDLRRAEWMKRQAMALDPLFWVHPLNLARILREQGRFGEALALGRRAVALGGDAFAHDEVFWAQLRLGQFEAARETLAEVCQQAGADSGGCVVDRSALDHASGRAGEAESLLAQYIARQATAGSVDPSSVGLGSLYANDLNDIPRATAALREAVRTTDITTMFPLLNGPAGARLPEEVSQDPDWLAAWDDPRLREVMAMYRENLTEFRKPAQALPNR